MHPTLPTFLVPYLPKRHRTFYAERQGAMRHDWLMCECGNGVKLNKISGPVVHGKPTVETEEVLDEHWLELVNKCRVSEHSHNKPCLPITLDGQTQPLRDRPPEAQVIARPTAPLPPDAAPPTQKRGRKKKEVADA